MRGRPRTGGGDLSAESPPCQPNRHRKFATASTPGALQLDGINRNLNGVDTSADFWLDPFTLGGPDGLFHSVQFAAPAPSGLVVLALAALTARRRRRSAPNPR